MNYWKILRKDLEKAAKSNNIRTTEVGSEDILRIGESMYDSCLPLPKLKKDYVALIKKK